PMAHGSPAVSRRPSFSQEPNILTRPAGPVKGISGESLSLHSWTLPGGSVLEGDYVCRAHNDAGESSVTVPVVIVAYAPRITIRPPQAIHTMPGAAVQLHCAALGIPKPEISWELPDHSVLSTDNLGRASGSQLLHPSGTLLIQNPRPSDSGTYKCTAKNHLGTLCSAVHNKYRPCVARYNFPMVTKAFFKNFSLESNCINLCIYLEFWFLNSVDRSKKQPSVVREKYLHDGRRWSPTCFTLMNHGLD
uniref:Immunoglobulin superfamily member 10 n=1 Tax=Bubo bubo TaxID=30461 RepID=A0A8C0EV30_BUBBB